MFTPTMFSRGRLLLRARLLVRDGAQHAVVVPGEVLHAAAVGEEVAEAEAVALVGLVHVAEEAERTYIHKYIYIYIYIYVFVSAARLIASRFRRRGGEAV